MNSRSYKLIFVLLSFCLLAILVLQGFWLRNFYIQKTEEFNRTVYATLEQLTQKLKERDNIHALKMTYFIQNGDTIAKTPSRNMTIASYEEVNVINNDTEHVTIREVQTSGKKSKHKTPGDPLTIVGNGKNVKIILSGRKATVQANEHKKSLEELVGEGTKLSKDAKDIKKLVDKMITEINVIDVDDNDPDTLNSLIKRVMHNKGIFIPFEFSLQKLQEGKKQILAQSKDFNDKIFAYKTDLSANNVFNTHKFFFLQLPNESYYVFGAIRNMLFLSIVFSLIIIGIFYFTLRLILNQKNLSEIRNDFVNNMTHELKTPIATNSLAIDALSNPLIKNDESRFKDYIRILKEENRKLNSHVERVLQVALLDKGNLPLNKRSVDLVAIIRTAINNYQLQINEQKAMVNFDTGGEPLMINGDEEHLQTVFGNLLDNALKYSSPPCVIDIKLVEREKDIFVHFKDNGIGIDKEQRSKVFDKFYRVQGGNLHDVKGFGLGLSYVKSIVEAHGGSVELDPDRHRDEKGKGSEFVIAFKKLTT